MLFEEKDYGLFAVESGVLILVLLEYALWVKKKDQLE